MTTEQKFTQISSLNAAMRKQPNETMADSGRDILKCSGGLEASCDEDRGNRY